MVKTLGIGWIKNSRYGLRGKRKSQGYADLKSLYLKLNEKKIFKCPVDNFNRFDQASKLASIAIALALYDAGIVYAKGKKQNIGILGTSPLGATDANLAYFRDYIAGKRILGRANLFIYTLPSSSLAEAAIHFGLTGPLLYMGFSGNSQDTRLIEHAKNMVKSGQAKAIVVLKSTNKETVCFIIGVK